MTGSDALADDVAAWSIHVPSPAVLGQVELLLAGIHGPARVTVDVPASVGEASAEAGHLVLTDEEGKLSPRSPSRMSLPSDDGRLARSAGRRACLRTSWPHHR